MLRILVLLAATLAFSTDLLAAGDSHSEEKSAALSLEERLQHLEQNQAELYHTLAGKKEAGIASRIAERITLAGLLEVEAAVERAAGEDGTSDSASDLTLATVQTALGILVNEYLTLDVSLLYEEGATDLEIDEATVNFAYGPWSGRVGQQYLPFGVFHSHFISDPLTLELGETRDTALLAGFSRGRFALAAFVLNGAAEEDGGEDHLDDWGGSLVLTPADGLSLGGSYLSDLADADGDLLGGEPWQRRVGGWSAFAIWEKGRLGLAGEILGAVRAFDAADLDADADGDGDRPLAWNLEAGWDLRDNLEIALRLEGSREFVGQPERRYGADLSWAPREQVSLSLEYLRGEFDPRFSAIERSDLVTAQLAVEF